MRRGGGWGPKSYAQVADQGGGGGRGRAGGGAGRGGQGSTQKIFPIIPPKFPM